MLWAHAWVWFAAALGLGILEVLLPGFILLGFALGAAVVGVVLAVGFSPSLSVSLLIFAVASLVAWLGLRHFFRLRTGQVKTFDHDING